MTNRREFVSFLNRCFILKTEWQNGSRVSRFRRLNERAPRYGTICLRYRYVFFIYDSSLKRVSPPLIHLCFSSLLLLWSLLAVDVSIENSIHSLSIVILIKFIEFIEATFSLKKISFVLPIFAVSNDLPWPRLIWKSGWKLAPKRITASRVDVRNTLCVPFSVCRQFTSRGFPPLNPQFRVHFRAGIRRVFNINAEYVAEQSSNSLARSLDRS